MTDERNSLLAQVGLGLDADQFFTSDLGKYVCGVAIQDKDAAANKLIEISPKDTATIAKLQVEAKACTKAIAWLNEALLMGRNAEHELYQREAEDND